MFKKFIKATLCAAALAAMSAPALAKTAVVYFSASGNTKAVAANMAKVIGADVLEITPAEPYTGADLNYHDDNCRANREMKDPAARPGIANDLSAVTGYDTVVIGYPIWWGVAPRIINTFLEKYDLSGREIYTFCTAIGSSVEKSVSELKAAYPKLNIIRGTRLYHSSSDDELKGAAGR